MAVDDGAALLVELERLRGTVSTGFAEVNGRLDGMAQRTTGAEEDVKELQGRVSALERKVWMAAGVAAVLSGGGAAGILAIIGQ